MTEIGVPGRQFGLVAKSGLLTTAMVVGLGLCEGVARLVYPAPPDPAREPQLLFEANRLAGFLHVPNQEGYLGDAWATINAIGLRGDLPQMPKPPGTTRILAIGDSTTFGWGVGDQETYCAQLERLLTRDTPTRRLDVVNGGVAAYDATHEVGLLRQLAPILKPDIVVVGIYWNDLLFEGVAPGDVTRDVSSAMTSATRPSTRTSKPFRLANRPSSLNQWLRSSRLIFTLRHAWRSAIAPTAAAASAERWEMAILEGRQSAAIDAAWTAMKESLREMRALGEAGGFSIGIVIMPIRAQVEDRYPGAVYQARLGAIAESLGLFVVDPLPGFIEHVGEDLFLPYDRAHYTARGNALVAEAVAAALRRRPELSNAISESRKRSLLKGLDEANEGITVALSDKSPRIEPNHRSPDRVALVTAHAERESSFGVLSDFDDDH